MKKVKKLPTTIVLWLLICVLSLTSFATVNAAESDIIYEYKTITQKKDEAFSSVLEKAGLNDAEKGLVNAIPIYHKAYSKRQLRFAYRVENGKKILQEVKVTRDNRLANYVLSEKDGKAFFLQQPTQIITLPSTKNVVLQSTPTDKAVPQKNKGTSNTTQEEPIQLSSAKLPVATEKTVTSTTAKKTDSPVEKPKKTAPISLVSTVPDNLIGVGITQAKGQSLGSALSVAQLSSLQTRIVKDGNYLKVAKSDRQFNFYFVKDGKKRILKGMRLSRNNVDVDFIVKKLKLVNLRTLSSNERQQWQHAFTKTTVKRLKSASRKQSVTDKATAKTSTKKKPITLSSVTKNSGKYKVITLTQKKGQSLYSAIKAAKLTSTQRNLIISMPATKSAKSTRKIYVLLENHHLRGLRIVRGRNVAEYVLFKYKGKWKWANEKGQIHTEGGGRFARWPVNFLRVSSPFNLRRRHPISRRIRPHKGIDLKAAHGTPIYAPASGVVRFSGRQRGYGITLEIDHQNGYRTKYAHLSRIMRSARTGRYVKKGQLIAKVGNTGVSTGAHLHYEVIVNGRHRNPATVRLPGGSGGIKTVSEAKKAVKQYLPILRRLSR